MAGAGSSDRTGQDRIGEGAPIPQRTPDLGPRGGTVCHARCLAERRLHRGELTREIIDATNHPGDPPLGRFDPLRCLVLLRHLRAAHLDPGIVLHLPVLVETLPTPVRLHLLAPRPHALATPFQTLFTLPTNEHVYIS